MRKFLIAAMSVALLVGVAGPASAHHHHKEQGVKMHIRAQAGGVYRATYGRTTAPCKIAREGIEKYMARPFEDKVVFTMNQVSKMCLKDNGDIDKERSYCESGESTSWFAHWRFDHWVEQVKHIYSDRMYCRSRANFQWDLPWPIPYHFQCEMYVWMQFKKNGEYSHGWKVTSCT